MVDRFGQSEYFQRWIKYNLSRFPTLFKTLVNGSSRRSLAPQLPALQIGNLPLI